MTHLDGAVIRPAGEAAFVVEYGDTIDAEHGLRVAALAAAFDRANPVGLVEVVPTFRSLLVIFDPDATTREALLAVPTAVAAAGPVSSARWSVPVALDGDAAEDIAEVATALGLTVDDIRARLAGSRCAVGMYGFAPGFAYLQGLDPMLAIGRRATPRRPMPAGSLIIAGGMAAFASVSMPTGWYVVGRTALTMFDPARTPMVPFAVGDRVELRRVSEAEIRALARRADGGVHWLDGAVAVVGARKAAGAGAGGDATGAEPAARRQAASSTVAGRRFIGRSEKRGGDNDDGNGVGGGGVGDGGDSGRGRPPAPIGRSGSVAGRIRLVRANPLVTLQDHGRQIAMRYGVSPSGPMDRPRFTLACALAGNPAAAFEIGLAGATFAAEGRVAIALAGPGFSVRINGTTFLPPLRLTLGDGDTLDVIPGRSGMWAYLAAAGLDPGPALLGSFATNARTGLGARDLTAGFACADGGVGVPERSVIDEFVDPFDDPSDNFGPIAILPAAQTHLFAADVVSRIAAEPWRVTEAVDRMGYRLAGQPLPACTHDIVSDGIVEGAIQVPGDGQPIVLLADRAPTGGYPKIAVVAAADLHRLAQRRPGDIVRFVWSTLAEANRRRQRLADLARREPARRGSIDTATLMANNLVSGVWPEDDV